MIEAFDRVVTMPSALREGFVAAYEHAKMLMGNGERVHLSVKVALDPIRIQQRKFLKDVVCQQIAEQVQIDMDGKLVRYNKAAWAEYFRKEFLGHRYETEQLPGQKTAHRVKVRNSTEELGVQKYSLHTDKVIDSAIVDWHVEFHFTREERDEVRYVAKPRARQ